MDDKIIIDENIKSISYILDINTDSNNNVYTSHSQIKTKPKKNNKLLDMIRFKKKINNFPEFRCLPDDLLNQITEYRAKGIIKEKKSIVDISNPVKRKF